MEDYRKATFSVLIAHYNNDVYFKDCYQSLLNQTYTDWEAIILDDSSTPESKEKVRAIIGDDDRFKFFENKQNRGVGYTKYKLIELANGKYCGFLDPDDALTPSAINDAMEVFSKDKNVVLTYSQFVKCNSELEKVENFKSAMQVLNGNKYFFNCPVQIHHFVCFNKSIYETTEKINTELKIAEDQDLYLKMYEKGKVKFIPKNNYLYRMHSGGISQNEKKRESHEYFSKVIFNAIQRRGIKKINGKKVPEQYSNAKEIFDLLEYQNSIGYRILKKIKLIFNG